MNNKVRRRLDMGGRALQFSIDHPDASTGYAEALARLQRLMQEADGLTKQQREGIRDSRIAASRKRELYRSLKSGPLEHLASVAKVAAVEDPDLPGVFALPRDTTSYLAFRAAARGIEAEAVSRKELLMRYGMSEPVLQGFSRDLAEFDAVMEKGRASRSAHVGASFELDDKSSEIVQVVKVMSGHNRAHFRGQGELLKGWESASSVVASPQPADDEPAPEVKPPASGEVRPAA